MWRHEGRRIAAELAAGCGAFLLGHDAERIAAHGEPVPVWAWTNLLAHGSEEVLRAAAQLELASRRAVRHWDRGIRARAARAALGEHRPTHQS